MLHSSSYLLLSIIQPVAAGFLYHFFSDVDYTAPITALADENRWSMFRAISSYFGYS
jgi:hypothetical protein